jgi:tRNA A37 threonylcarbamoyladenosine biosynthesis protein TsaE
LIWEDLQEMKAWYPHRVYLKKIGVEVSEWPEDIKFRFLYKDLDVYKRCRYEAHRRAEIIAKIEERLRLTKDIVKHNVEVKALQKMKPLPRKIYKP